MRWTGILILLLLLPVLGYAQMSHYAGMEHREIKALSRDEINSYLNGEGMGYALAAELNQYPGPKHVLELANDLSLTLEQEQKTRNVYDDMHENAVGLGKELVQLESELDRMFQEGSINSSGLHAKLQEISSIQGQIRFAHLNAHLQMKEILTSDQIGKYQQMRGYHHTGHH